MAQGTPVVLSMGTSFRDAAPTQSETLSLHEALPIWLVSKISSTKLGCQASMCMAGGPVRWSRVLPSYYPWERLSHPISPLKRKHFGTGHTPLFGLYQKFPPQNLAAKRQCAWQVAP